MRESSSQGIDFSSIRAIDGRQDKGFEELVCQLARLDSPSEKAKFFRGRGDGGDGGVEAYWTMPEGTKTGYQAKYHPDGKIDWSKVDKSVRTAMAVHPTINCYVIGFPCNLSPPTRRRGKSEMERWEDHAAKWKKAFPDVVFVRWDETELIARLIRPAPEYVGIRAWFFELPDWTSEWFRARFQIAAADLGDRYHPEEHVDVSVAEVIAGLQRSPLLFEQLRAIGTRLLNAFEPVDDAFGLVEPGEPLADYWEAYNKAKSAIERLARILIDHPSDVSSPLITANLVQAYRWCRACLDRIKEEIPSMLKELDLLNISKPVKPTTHLFEAFQQAERSLSSPAFEADVRRAVLLVGSAGTGKSHLLADVADRATGHGLPVALIPGQGLSAASSPWDQILTRLDATHLGFEKALAALDAAAEAANQRALIIIDALNESEGAGGWRNHLGGLVEAILRFPRLGIAVSCRSDYLDWVVPHHLRDAFVTVECRGFVSPDEQERAAEVFLDRKGIARPAVPWLAPDFTNPLFLRVTTEGLKAAGQRNYPQFIGLSEFYGFFLRSLSVRHPFDKWQDPSLLAACLKALAREMRRTGRRWIPTPKATTVIQGALAAHDGGDSSSRALGVLKDLCRGALLSAPDPTAEKPGSALDPLPEGVILVFERLCDLLMAEAVIHDLQAESFQPGGQLAFVGKNTAAWAGLIGTLAILSPERRKMELFDLAPLRLSAEETHRQFRDSLLWRKADAFLPATGIWFQRLREDYQLEVVIRLAGLPGHPWNADRLDQRLRSQAMPDRDAAWSVPLALSEGDARGAVDQIIDWALGNGCTHASDETLRLTATVLAWMLTTSDRTIRDDATKALARVFLLRPGVMGDILGRFHIVDDPYVVERLWAAAYGAAMNSGIDWPLPDLARQTWRLCFADGEPPVSLRTRDHAQGIMELAAARNALPAGIPLERCRPPFKSGWPLDDAPTELVEQQRHRDGAWDVVSSVVGGDFGRYTLAHAVERWSDVPLTEPAPLNGEQKFTHFVAEVVEGGSAEIQAAWEAYLFAEAEERDWAFHALIEERKSKRKVEHPDGGQALATFLAQLADGVAPEAKSRIEGQREQLSHFDRNFAERWLVKRVIDIGWTAKRFHYFEEVLRGHSGERPEVERIGKKYQWIALDELLARLSDNVHHIRDFENVAAPFRNTADQPFFRDCDPSILPLSSGQHDEAGGAWWLPNEASLPPRPAATWVQSDEDVWASSDLFDVKDPNGRPWLLMYGFTKQDDGVDPRQREVWSRVTTVMIRKADRTRILEALQGRHISEPSGHQPPTFTDDGYYGEFPWRDTWPKEACGTGRDAPGLLAGQPVFWPIIGYHWEGHIDLSMGSIHIHMPSGWLCEVMGLEPKFGKPGTFIDGNRDAVFIDPAAFTDHSTVAVIDRRRFQEFLENSEWDCLWLIGGEKTYWPDGRPESDRWACRYHSAVHWWEKGGWQSRTWSDSQSRGL